MQDANGNLKMKWNRDFNKIQNTILNGKRTIQQAKFYMEQKYIGDGREAFNYLMYAHPSDIILESKLYNLICDAIKLGYGEDYNFEKVFR